MRGIWLEKLTGPPIIHKAANSSGPLAIVYTIRLRIFVWDKKQGSMVGVWTLRQATLTQVRELTAAIQGSASNYDLEVKVIRLLKETVSVLDII